jgi:hypothetical protein
MNSNFNTFGRKNIVMGRPLDPRNYIVPGEPIVKAETKAWANEEACAEDGCKYDGQDDEMKKPADVRAAVTSGLNTFLQELIANALAGVETAAKEMDDTDDLEMTIEAGWEPEDEVYRPQGTNRLELHGVKSHSLYGTNLSVTLENDAAIYFNDALLESGKVDMTLKGNVNVVMIGTGMDMEMELYYDDNSRLYSNGPYTIGSTQFHSIGLAQVFEGQASIGAGIQGIQGAPAKFLNTAQIQAQTAVSEPKYDQSYFDKMLHASHGTKLNVGFDSMGQAYGQQTAQTAPENTAFLKAAFINPDAGKNLGVAFASQIKSMINDDTVFIKKDAGIGVINKAPEDFRVYEAQPVLMGYVGTGTKTLAAEIQISDDLGRSAQTSNLIGHAGLCEEINVQSNVQSIGLSQAVLNPAVEWASASVRTM